MAFSDEGRGPNDGPDDDATSFSSYGAADLSNPRSGGAQVALPEFFDRSLKVDFGAEGTGIDAGATPRERFLAEDAATADTTQSRMKSPRI